MCRPLDVGCGLGNARQELMPVAMDLKIAADFMDALNACFWPILLKNPPRDFYPRTSIADVEI